MTGPTGYPHHLAGDPAPPPAQVERRVLGMALKVHAKHLAAVDHQLVTAAPWRVAHSLEQLVAEADAAAPDRNKASDGSIGDARHQQSASDHNPGPIVGGKAIVRAVDLTNDPALELPAVAERIRARAAARGLPQVFAGGYVILNGRITAEDWSGWRHYTGTDPHVSHMHVSSSRTAAAFDSRERWGVFSNEQSPPPAPAPPAPEPAGWTGPDLTGTGPGLRGDVGNNGPRVRALQRFLTATYPLYAKHLDDDGWWGPQTTGVLAEFAHRSGIGSADGTNVGPLIARRLLRAGFRS